MALRRALEAAEQHIISGRRPANATLTRLLKLGPISLLALFAGGLILILGAINALLPTDDNHSGGQNFTVAIGVGEGLNRFRVGSTWSVQAWIAILGVGFGLLSHGLHEAYAHLFDWWCSRKAQGGSGLDYARYLNTQPRAPVTYGVRGFPALASLRYVLLASTIAASIGYKFGIGETTSPWAEHLRPDQLVARVANGTKPLDAYSKASPWFKGGNQCFTYEFQKLLDEEGRPQDDTWGLGYGIADLRAYDLSKAPLKVIMASQVSTKSYLTDLVYALGWITSREVVAVADLTEEQGNFTMSRDEGDWFRVQTLGENWSNDTQQQRVIVDYRALDRGKVQIQWAPLGPWLTDDDAANQTQQVTQRVTYNMYYATAEVGRTFFDTSEGLSAGAFRGHTITMLAQGGQFPSEKRSNEFLRGIRNWVDAQVADEANRASDGVNAIVRAVMYGWARDDAWSAIKPPGLRELGWTSDDKSSSDYKGEYLRILPTGEDPFGKEDDSRTQRSLFFPNAQYPYFDGNRHRGITGCFPAAAGVFMAVGIIAWILLGLRVYIGPAELTSWTGQHVYLSQVGVISGLEKQEDLASGYLAAPANLGRLHLGYQRMQTTQEGE